MIRTNNVASMLRSDIGVRLAHIRETLALSQAELAEKIGVSARSYQNYEQGKREFPTSLVYELCSSLGVNSHWLLTGKGGRIYFEPAKLAKQALEEIIEAAEVANLRPALKKIPDVLEIVVEQETSHRGLNPEELTRLIKLASTEA